MPDPWDQTGTPVSWYENFFYNRVLPKVCKEMETVGSDFYSWMAEQAPEFYCKINEAEKEINSLWLGEADHESFKGACKTWYNLLLEAKTGYEDWKAKQLREQQLAGRQETMVMR